MTVIALPGSPDPTKPDPDIIASIEELLAMARAGGIRGFATACVHQDGSFGTTQGGWIDAKFIGAAALLQHRMVSGFDPK